MDGDGGIARGKKGSRRQIESGMKSRYMSCSRFRWRGVRFSLRENSDIAGLWPNENRDIALKITFPNSVLDEDSEKN